ncbi:MAG: S8 family serine peptidase [Phycisphaerales bacterium]|nr:S8 family serine peptidase [Phycisphaerales bacterium]
MKTRRNTRWVWVLAGTAVLAGGTATHAVNPQNQTWVRAADTIGGWASTHVVVRVKEGVRADELSVALTNTIQRWDVTSITPTTPFPFKNQALAHELGLDRYYTLHVPAGTDTPAMVQHLTSLDSHIELAELDGIGGLLATYPSDSYFGNQYGLHNTGQNIEGQTGIADADIDAPEAWDLHTGTNAITLALIDTGVSESHPDLNDKRITGYNAQDGSSNTDDSWLISHGTHCSGIAAAESNNGQGVSGVSWGAKIMPIKVLNALGSGTETECANGVIWAADHGADVGSMSLGYPDGITYFQNAINYAHGQGMVLVAATGNDGGPPIYPPARWANVIAVGATDNRDNLASFTSTGPEMSVAAPGVNNYSCIDDLFNGGLDSYTYMSGTSMACPHVAGLACLVWSANLTLTNDQVRSIIESTADDKGATGWDQQFGHGRVNARAAVEAAIGGIEPTIDHQLVEVTISAAAIADDPTLAHAATFDLQVIMTEGDDWTSTNGTATIDGSFYQHPSFDSNTPQPGWWASFPSLEFDSFFSGYGFDAPAFAEGPTVTNDSMSAVWFDTVNAGTGTYTIGRFTVTSGTVLSVSGTSTANYTQGDLHEFSFDVDVDLPTECPGDFDGDGYRGQSDLGILLAAYELNAGGDMDGDGDTDQADLGAFLAVYDTPCP